MDVVSLSSPKKTLARCRRPLRAFLPRNPPSRDYGDRFISNRSSMNFDVAHYLLSQSSKEKENAALGPPSRGAYRKLLAETLMMNRIRILSFKNKPPKLIDQGFFNGSSSAQIRFESRGRHVILRVLDAPDLVDDFYLNLLDWGSRNFLSITLGNTMYFWNGSDVYLGACDHGRGDWPYHLSAGR